MIVVYIGFDLATLYNVLFAPCAPWGWHLPPSYIISNLAESGATSEADSIYRGSGAETKPLESVKTPHLSCLTLIYHVVHVPTKIH